MGASFVFGKQIEKKPYTQSDGREFLELITVDGGMGSISYSSVEKMVELCETNGISRDVWPIYPGISDSEVDLTDVKERCAVLKTKLALLDDKAISHNEWLSIFVSYLGDDQIFCIFG